MSRSYTYGRLLYCSIADHSNYSTVVNLTVRGSHAHHLFDEVPNRDLYLLNTQLTSYLRNGNPRATWDLFRRIHCEYTALTAYTFTPVLGACSALPGSERGRQVHGLMVKTGAESGPVKTTLLDMYSKYGYLDDSVRVFEEIQDRDVVAWNTMLSSCLRNGFAEKALGVFAAMRRGGMKFSEFTLCSVLKACASLKAVRPGKQVHGLVVVMGRDLVILGTALIDLYSTVECVGEAIKVFSSLGWGKDDAMHNSLISGCVRNRKYKEAFSVMSRMKPNVVALTSALSACAENSDLWIGKQIHCVAIRFRLISDTQLCNVILDMYAKCGKILSARLLFDTICYKDVVSWTTMIDAYGSHGHGHEALELFKKMGEGDAVLPNAVTFLVILSACGHSGLVDQGQECFDSMKMSGLEPGPEHYACLIDILGRAGLIEGVWRLYHDMVKDGVKPAAEVWTALLNSCTLNLDISRGEFAAKHLLELEPNKPGNYVLLSNFYAAAGKWDSVNTLRDVMKKKWLVKEVGSSWVTTTHGHKDASKVQIFQH
ncbi:pentatricopeptide repeat-containing protein [Tripterygium wilfordii]|uniref:Pentatricopeptide repeat-containing protein n=1 Tax=Tripterygium wilfordii TaxID=458696 RepID=A0A7J7CVM4_TRIWF|nr:pentatricopeptide repeat-containing protein At5g66500, mitochondrial-like [Tripterygium wilfordii]KAF5738147.1 pentatricopeptide repeat-containing protein [Tripterygium wilfordii]